MPRSSTSGRPSVTRTSANLRAKATGAVADVEEEGEVEEAGGVDGEGGSSYHDLTRLAMAMCMFFCLGRRNARRTAR
jgi:hypothetical protein